MTHRLRDSAAALVTALAILCACSPAATATVTSSTTTVAAAFGFADYRSLPLANRHVSATTNGTTGDNVDFICRQGVANFTFASDVPVSADGGVSADVSENKLDSRYCRLAAVPSGTTPSNLAPFSGPFVGGGEISLTKISTGSNTGVVFDHYIDQAQGKGFADYDSLGDCGLCDMSLFDAAGASSPYLFYDNARIGFQHLEGATQKQGATVDGQTAYDSWHAQSKAFNNAGLPPLSVTSYSVDPATGDMTFTEKQELVLCSPSDSTCTSFVPSGLRYDRTVRQDHNGRWVRITDTIVNLDAGTPHTFDFDFEQFEQASAHHLGYRLPGESGYSEHAAGGTTAAGFGPITTIGLINDATQAIAFNNPVGTLTTSPQPTRLLYDNGGFYLDFTGSVPPGGTQTISQYYAMGESQGEVDGYATAQRDELGLPTVAITSPADGTNWSVRRPPPVVTGTASDNVAVTSLKVNGATVPVAADGTWTAQVPLNLGANTITAVAGDGAGNTATATVTISLFRPPLLLVTVSRSGKVKVKRTGRKFLLDTGLVVHCPPGVSACSTVGSAKTVKAVYAKLHRRKVTLAKRTVRIAGGKSTRIVLTFTPKGVKVLRRNKRLAIKITLANLADLTTTTTRAATITRPKH